MFRAGRVCLGRKTEFLKRLELVQTGLKDKILLKKHWAQVYSDDCVMTMASQEVKGLETIISPLPEFTRAFDIVPSVVEVIGNEDDEKFAVWYKHEARFVEPYGRVQPTGQTGTFEGVNIHTVSEDGTTTHLVQSMDLLSYFMQVGAINPMMEQEEEEPDLAGTGTVQMPKEKPGVKSL